jgi:formylglycine-generating enzyme
MEGQRLTAKSGMGLYGRGCTIPTNSDSWFRVEYPGNRAYPEICSANGDNMKLALRVNTQGHVARFTSDGKKMILIPAGEFVMGSDEVEDEKPPHKLFLELFYFARYPVTNSEYQEFVDATKHSPPPHWINGRISGDKRNHPVVNVSWNDAVAYSEWAGGRLPTEAEWEKAASWDDVKKEKRRYPWGNDFDAFKCNSLESRIGDTTPVGEYSPHGDSAYGVGDMAGNVWEWCADWYDGSYHENSPAQNPTRPDSGYSRVVRGGAWDYNQDYARNAFRLYFSPDDWADLIGFLLVMAPSVVLSS